MTSETDYNWWINALAGNVGPISDGYPECGFYRRKQKDKTFCAVAIWRDSSGEIVAVETRGNNARPVDAADTWTWVAKYPIREEVYRAYCDTGRWPDMDEAVAEQVEARGIGDNQPPDDLAILKDQIESAKAGIAAYEKIADDETLAKAQSLRSRLLELSREADKKREAEKRPHLEAGKAVDAKYQPLVKEAKAAADTVAKAMGAFETEKLRREREAQRKAEEERRAAEEAARASDAPAPEPEPAPAPAPAPAAPIRGAYGRAASVRLVKVVTEVKDWDALWGFMREHPEVKELLRKLAQRAVDTGREVPGVEVEEQRKVA